MTAASTPCPLNQAAISSSALGTVAKQRVSTMGAPDASHRRTVAVISILCTSRPAARGQTICMPSVFIPVLRLAAAPAQPDRRMLSLVRRRGTVAKTRGRHAAAVRFAARPRPQAGHNTGCDADRRKQFLNGNRSPVKLRSRTRASDAGKLTTKPGLTRPKPDPETDRRFIQRGGSTTMAHVGFWHRHPGCRKTTMPISGAEFWRDKFDATVKRDAKAQEELRQTGWTVLVIWECEVTPEGLDRLLRQIITHPTR